MNVRIISFVMSLLLLLPAAASAESFGLEFFLFGAVWFVVAGAVLSMLIAGIKYLLCARFFGDRWRVSKKEAFALILCDSALYAGVLLGIFPGDMTMFFPWPATFLGLSDSIGIFFYGISLESKRLYNFLSNIVVAIPVYYPISVFITSRLFIKSAKKKEKTPVLKGTWPAAAAMAVITPVGICFAILSAASPFAIKSPAVIDALFTNAVIDANVNMAGALLRKGAHINARAEDGNGVLYHAFAFGRMPVSGTSMSMVKFLLDNGADVNAVEGENGQTVLMKACEGYGRLEEFRLLLDRKPDLNVVDGQGNDALHYALQRGQTDKAALLLASEVTIDKQDKEGETSLMKAVVRGDMSVVQFLIENGADIHLKDICGRTALRRAATGDRKEFVELLLERGADPKDVDSTLMTCSQIVPMPVETREVVKSLPQMGVPPQAMGRSEMKGR